MGEGEAIPLNNDSVQAAAMWLADRPGEALPIPAIRERFDLTMKQACDACALAQRFRTLRGAFA